MNRCVLEDGTVLSLRDTRKDIVDWIHLRDKKRAVVNILINLWVRRVQPTRRDVSQFIYFCKTLYMFPTDFLSIIRSSKLHVQCQVFVRPILLPAASLARLAANTMFKDSSVRLDDPGFEPSWVGNFSYSSRPAPRSPQPTIRWAPGLFSGDKAAGAWC